MKCQLGVVLVAGFVAAASIGADLRGAEPDVRFMIVDPGHFHAGLVQKEMYPDVARRVDVFAPLGPDLVDHLNRIAAFNRRAEKPTSWEVEVHTSPDFFERMLRDRPGNVVILSGRNRAKIDRIVRSVGAGLHVLADKPWILKSEDLPKLEQALAEAEAKGRIAYDIMTERFEVTNSLQRALVSDKATFGEIVRGTADEPAVYMESVHYLKKVVAGVPNVRPPWFFDTAEQGEGLNDVGTHLVDLVQWTLFPNQALSRSDVEVIAAQRWPTVIPEAEFRVVTNAAKFPDDLAAHVKDGKLEYFSNTLVSYTLRGVQTKLNVIWDWEPAAGAGDTHFAFYRGSRSRIEVRQTRGDRYQPQLYVIPNTPASKADVLSAVRTKVASLQAEYPGVAAVDQAGEIRIEIPDKFRVGHEAHFAEVTASFLRYIRNKGTLPAWERPNMITKYLVSTKGTELSRAGASKAAPRLAPQ
jgi:predicted dehydrogenase